VESGGKAMLRRRGAGRITLASATSRFGAHALGLVTWGISLAANLPRRYCSFFALVKMVACSLFLW
jgi:hypothetical protein